MTIQTIPLTERAQLFVGKRPVTFVAEVDVTVDDDLQTVRRTLHHIELAYADTVRADFLERLVGSLGLVSITQVGAAALDEYVEALNEARDRLDELGITWPTKSSALA